MQGAAVDLDELVRLRFTPGGAGFGARQPVSSQLAGRHGSRLRGRGLDFVELRAYRPGDDIRAMDWRATARTRRPQLRVYAEEKERPVLLVVDQRRSMFFGSVRDMKSVTAARAAAWGLWRVLARGDRAGLVVFDDAQVWAHAPTRARAAAQRALGTLVRANRALLDPHGPPPDVAGLHRALDRAAVLAPTDALVVVISDFHGVGSASRERLTRLRRRNDVVLVPITDPIERQLPLAALAVSDGRQQAQVQVGDTLRQAFEQEQLHFEALVRRLGQLYDVPVLPLSTDRDAVDQLRELLGQRARASR